MPAKIETVLKITPPLSDEETSFLLTAFSYWSKPSNFSDEQVAQTKTIFRRVFNIDSELKGREFADALVLQPIEDRTLFYAMMVARDEDGDCPLLTWKKAYVNAVNFQILNSHLTPFEEFLSMVGAYCYKEKGGDTFLYDFFKFWQRKFSPERIARVARKISSTQRSIGERIPRNKDTLKRMRWELCMLGFEEEGVCEDGSLLFFNWVDPIALDKGFAPQSFTVALTDGEDGEDSSSTDEEAEGLSDGVFIEEKYGYSTVHLMKWEQWDYFLLDQMKSVV